MSSPTFNRWLHAEQIYARPGMQMTGDLHRTDVLIQQEQIKPDIKWPAEQWDVNFIMVELQCDLQRNCRRLLI